MRVKLLFLLATLFFGVLNIQADKLSDYDRQIVASCMVLEAGCDGEEGLQAVLNVILNRADGYLHRLVPQTIKRGAFSCMDEIWSQSAPDYSRLLRRAHLQTKAYGTALLLISTMEDGQLWDNTLGATHYHAVSMTPYWISEMSFITTIGGHHFYSKADDQLASL
jgi:N-acetylmuramoyl-L-alanine amidase